MSSSHNNSTNSLVKESSPYLLQHAHNPVNWFPYGKEAFDLAKKENKPVLISVGYSACHWCHVMAHESFEDEGVAEIMNAKFINVKVDREERSDVDMLYMQAVQLMTGQGGWPLNCFVLPDGRPFYGGTYFQKHQWISILNSLSEVYQNDPAKVQHYAEELTKGIKRAEVINTSGEEQRAVTRDVLKESVARWKDRMDNTHGGPNRAPKFPLPSNYQFLLRYAALENDTELMSHVDLTLRKMAFGGIYDQLHGGFARYSTDMIWKVPHFEKMLYDNAQLVSLYAEAFAHSKNKLYQEVVKDTLDFIEQEWYDKKGFFYSAFDADSEGVEGKYYVWREDELRSALGENYELFSNYFEINKTGYWEHDNYILMRSEESLKLMTDFQLSQEEIDERIRACKIRLKTEAVQRIKPGLDDKSICSWNAMMCSAYARAYLVFGDGKYKDIALSSLTFIEHEMLRDGKLLRTYKNGHAKIDAFLEDYAFYIEALILGYLISQDESYLNKAKNICEYTLKAFHNPESDLLFYTSVENDELITRVSETSDNVIPASNSQMALNLFQLGTYFEIDSWKERAEKMLLNVRDNMVNYGAGYSNWACLALHLTYPFREVAIVGNNVNELFRELYKQGPTNAIFAVSAETSDLPLVKDRHQEDQTLIYVCENKTCQLPVTRVEEALKHFA